MEISEVRVKIIDNKDDRLKAFCSMTIDNCFVVRDIKIIEGTSGLFVAMPSRKMTGHCRCGAKNHLRANFCNNCGKQMPEDKGAKGKRLKLHADIAHPINAECRDMIQNSVIQAYEQELEKSRQPGYVPTELDTE